MWEREFWKRGILYFVFCILYFVFCILYFVFCIILYLVFMERLKPQLVGSLSCLANLLQFVFCVLLFVFYSLYFVFMRRMKRQFVGVLLPSCQPFLATYTILTGQLTSYHTLVIVAMVFIMSMGMRHKYFFLFWGDANKNNTHWSSWPLSPNAEGLISVLPFST